MEKNVPYKILTMLKEEHNITLVSNVDMHKLEKIARLTQTDIANEISVVDRFFKLGKCKLFKIVNHSKLYHE